MNPEDSTWLTIALEKILAVFGQGQHQLQGIAADLVINLAILEISVLLLWATLDGGARLSGIIKRIIFISVVYWGITHYDTVVELLVDSFVSVGEVAGSAGGSSPLTVSDPGGIFLHGVKLTLPWSEATGKSIWRWGISDLWRTFFWFAIVIAFGLLAIQVWLTRLEFGVLSCLGLIFLPLSVWKHGKWIAEKILGAYIAVAGKLMALAFIISVIAPILQDFQVSANGSFEDEANVVVAIFALLMLAWKAPNMIMAFLSGGAVIGLSSTGVVPRTGEILAGTAGVAGGIAGGGGRAYGRSKDFLKGAISAAGMSSLAESKAQTTGTDTGKRDLSSTKQSKSSQIPSDMSEINVDSSNGTVRLRSSSIEGKGEESSNGLTPPKVHIKPSFGQPVSSLKSLKEENNASPVNPRQNTKSPLERTAEEKSDSSVTSPTQRTRRSLARVRQGLSDDSEVSGNILIPIRTEDD